MQNCLATGLHGDEYSSCILMLLEGDQRTTQLRTTCLSARLMTQLTLLPAALLTALLVEHKKTAAQRAASFSAGRLVSEK